MYTYVYIYIYHNSMNINEIQWTMKINDNRWKSMVFNHFISLSMCFNRFKSIFNEHWSEFIPGPHFARMAGAGIFLRMDALVMFRRCVGMIWWCFRDASRMFRGRFRNLFGEILGCFFRRDVLTKHEQGLTKTKYLSYIWALNHYLPSIINTIQHHYGLLSSATVRLHDGVTGAEMPPGFLPCLFAASDLSLDASRLDLI